MTATNIGEPEHVTQARIEQVQPHRVNWWLPLLAIALAAYLGAQTWFKRGPLVTIHTDQGHALGVGDPLKYRGVTLGEVESARLAADFSAVTLQVRLQPDAEPLCRVGSRFWVVHPEVGLDRVQGLETIVGARYLRVEPGDADAPALYEFAALGEAPADELREPGGLSIRLLALRRHGLARGAQVTYRGIQVGSVLETRLTSDATGVEIDAYIRPAYANLVRDDTRFWRTGGFEVNLALLSGLSVELDSLRGLIVGGIAFATPDDPGSPSSAAQPFVLHDEAKQQWEDWRPSLPVGSGKVAAPSGAGPAVLRATLRYEAGRFWGRDKQRDGWVIALPGAVLGPRELLAVPEKAREDSVTLEVDGAALPLPAQPLWEGLGLVKLAVEDGRLNVLHPAAVRFAPALQDCSISSVPGARTLSVSRARLKAEEAGWRLAEDIELSGIESGSLVYGQQDERYVGVLLKTGDSAHIVPFLAEQW